MGMTHEDRKKVLSPVMKRFVEEVLKDPSDNAAAYMRANPKCSNKKSASVQASKYMKMDKIREAIEEMAQDVLGSRKVAILKNVDFWLGIRDNEENRVADRMKASENLGKYMQMFVEKKEISADVSVRIVDDIS